MYLRWPKSAPVRDNAAVNARIRLRPHSTSLLAILITASRFIFLLGCWGGHSLHTKPRTHRVSFNRPYDRGYGSGEKLFWEYSLVRTKYSPAFRCLSSAGLVLIMGRLGSTTTPEQGNETSQVQSLRSSCPLLTRQKPSLQGVREFVPFWSSLTPRICESGSLLRAR
jgi:hypothetical protein